MFTSLQDHFSWAVCDALLVGRGHVGQLTVARDEHLGHRPATHVALVGQLICIKYVYCARPCPDPRAREDIGSRGDHGVQNLRRLGRRPQRADDFGVAHDRTNQGEARGEREPIRLRRAERAAQRTSKNSNCVSS